MEVVRMGVHGQPLGSEHIGSLLEFETSPVTRATLDSLHLLK